MQYRREIDGLRAVAVLPVILFHAGLTFWSGGFVGVDVFFVISGYLITTILIDERERGTYSIWGFYERRARRILPALFVVLLACTPFAWFWIPPYPFEDFARSLAFATLFISNVHFLEHGGYFDLASELRPLLHTWSLAVEEQFYLLFPLVLFFLAKFRRRKFLIVFAILALLSLGVAEWALRNYPSENFYFTPSRLWELLAGSICAAVLYQRVQMKNEVLAGLGLAMILFSSVYFNAGLPFPSGYTLVPVLGTCLIILFARNDTLTARILSVKPMVAIGLISYSAYLWHQPLFAFARIRGAGDVADWVMLVLAGVAMVLAWISWRFVEQPFRGKTSLVLPTRRGALSASLIGILAFSAFGFSALIKEGYPSRLDIDRSELLARLYDQSTTHHAAESYCPEAGEAIIRDLCVIYTPEVPERKIAILGDSHSRVIVPAFRPLVERLNASLYLGDIAGCPPLMDVYLTGPTQELRACRDGMDNFFAQVNENGIDTVILVARWSLYATGDYSGTDTNFKLSLTPVRRLITHQERLDAFTTGVETVFDTLTSQGVKIVVVSQMPLQRHIPGIMIQNAMMLNLDDEEATKLFDQSAVDRELHDDLQSRARTVIGERAPKFGVTVLTLDDSFERDGQLIWFDGENTLYMDDDHISEVGANRLAPAILELLGQP